jgi:glycosyltransferase involved in cell wall biosynthesis
MGNTPKITALIPCYNEEHNIEAVLDSVKFADEIMVVDSFSTDNTVELAKKHTNKILQREYENSASQKNWAIPQATHEWIILVDADERVTPELEQEIRQTIDSGPEEVAFWIGRSNLFMGNQIQHGGYKNDRVIRLFKRDACKYENLRVHAEVLADGKVGTLTSKLKHNTYISIDHHLHKMNRYAQWQAEDLVNKIGRITPYHLIGKPVFRFIKEYLLQSGWRDGLPGFTLALIASYSVVLRYIKVWLIRKNLK